MLLRKAYYLLKPLLPWETRMAVRRFVANRIRRRCNGTWPINALAARTPEGWPGWPEGKKFSFVLTHDVEGQRGVDRCQALAEIEMKHGFRSSFNFIPEGEYQTPKALRDFLDTNGFEFGIHDLRHDGKLYSSRESFRAAGQKINKYLKDWGAVGFRSGFVFHQLDWLRDLNVSYDASTFDTDPFEPQPDGVNTIFPFWVPRKDGSGYVELPYTLPQDSTLFLVFRETTNDIWKRKLDWVAQHGGMALLNVHSDYLSFDGKKSSSEFDIRLYEDFLEYVNQRYRNDCWMALPRDVASYVREQRLKSAGAQGALEHLPPSIASATEPINSKSLATAGPQQPDAQSCFSGQGRPLQGKRAAMVMFSFHPGDPRPRRAAEALASEGMLVDMICLAEGAEPKHEVVDGVEVFRIPISRSRGSAFAYFYQYSTFILLSFLLVSFRFFTRGYDLVYVHNMPDVLVLSSLIPKLFGAKVILDLHDPMPELMMAIFGMKEDSRGVRFIKALERWSLALADMVVTVNRACEKIFSSRSCPAEKITVVMNSPDEGIFQYRPAQTPQKRGDKPFVIMYHGSLVERNGLDLAVEAMARLRHSIPLAELRIYGAKSPFLTQVLNKVQKLGLGDVVHHLGPRKLDGIVAAIEECDLGVIPNQRSIFTEINTPTRIFEYLALGKPVIAPRAPGICDYFDDQSLLFFELGDADDLARRIEYAYHHPTEVFETTRRGQAVHQAHAWRQERRRLQRMVTDLLCREAAHLNPETQKAQPSHHEGTI